MNADELMSTAPLEVQQLYRIRELEAEVARLSTGLKESVKLQSHYGQLLNMHDGGKRMKFDSVEEWLARLQQTGTLKKIERLP